MGRKPVVDDKLEVPDIKRGKPTINIQCGDCMFLHKAGVYKDSKGVPKPCSFFGTVSGHDPCRKFVANPTSLPDNFGFAVMRMGRIAKPQVLAAAFLAYKRVAKSGFNIGDTVFFHVMGGDYINNYASGIVVGGSNEFLVVSGEGDFCAFYQPENLMDRKAWDVKLDELLRKNKINDPNGGLRRIPKDTRLYSFTPTKISVTAKPKDKIKTTKNKKIKSKGMQGIVLR